MSFKNTTFTNALNGLAYVADGQPIVEHLKTGETKEVKDRLPGLALYLNYLSISGRELMIGCTIFAAVNQEEIKLTH
jgi:hypothetical protein